MLLNEAMLNQVRIEKSVVAESVEFKDNIGYDLFISHSFTDQNLVRKLRAFFKDRGFNVYVDWIDDAQLDRTNVTSDTAELIKHRISQCKALAYITTRNIASSKWCPWELGVADGLLGKVCILPFLEGNKEQYAFRGREYLGLYPYLSFNGQNNDPVICDPLKDSPKQFWDLSSTLSGMLYSIDLRNWLNSGDVA